MNERRRPHRRGRGPRPRGRTAADQSAEPNPYRDGEETSAPETAVSTDVSPSYRAPAGLADRPSQDKLAEGNLVACHYSEKEAKARGLNRTEGKTYIVKDADIMHILASS